ncbi:MAG: chitobiase/beta-hexosaminidase C-terminal domain-containing protein [Vicinamibacteria bacterium]|nr:chitobiase/beta-hexosaminidase C-terminal domain-containing protein [Vicinamibacteria bacterium]
MARALGLAQTPLNDLPSIKFGIQLGSDGSVAIVEDGVPKPPIGTYGTGDQFTVAVEGASVVYRQNAVALYTSSLAPVYPLFAQVVLQENGSLGSCVMGGNLGEWAEWTNVGAHVAAAPGSLAREPFSPVALEGATSTRGITSGGGFVEFRLNSPTNYIYTGLSHGDTDGGAADIDFSFRIWSTSLTVIENGVTRGSFGTAGINDVLRIGVENGSIVYRKNGTVLYTSLTAPQFPLTIDSSVNAGSASAASVTLSGALSDVAAPPVSMSPSGGAYPSSQSVTLTSAPGQTIYYTLDGTEPGVMSPSVASGGAITVDSSARLRARTISSGLWPGTVRSAFYSIGAPPITEVVEWTNIGANVSALAGSISRDPNVGSPSVSEGAASTRGINSPDGYVEFRTGGYSSLGLSYGDNGGDASDVDYAVRFWGSGFYITENGTSLGYFGSTVAGDVFRVGVENGVVTYRKNGTLVYTSRIGPRFPLLVDASMHPAAGNATAVALSGHLVDTATAAVQMAPGGGAFGEAQSVTLTSGTGGATVRYTLDGSEPGPTSPSVANGGSVVVPSTGWLRARAFAPEMWPSASRRAFFAIGTAATTEVVEWANVGPNLSVQAGAVWRSPNVGSPSLNEGAVSTRAINSPDGYVEFKAGGYGYLGLSYGDADGGANDVDYAIQFWASGFYITENGVSRGYFGSLAAGDIVRVAVESGNVVYRRNGAQVYASGVTPRFPLLVDVSMHPAAGNATGVTISGHLVDVATLPPSFSLLPGDYATGQAVTVTDATPGAIIYYTTNGADPTTNDAVVANGGIVTIADSATLKARAFAPGLFASRVSSARYTIGLTKAIEAVTWTNIVNAGVSGNSIYKATSGAASDGGGVSRRAITSTDGYMEFTAGTPWGNRGAGLSFGDTDRNLADIDYAIFPNNSGTIQIYEGGVPRGAFGSYVSSDVLRVEVENGVVKYKKNGALLYASGIAPRYPLLVDTSLAIKGANFANVMISGALADVSVAPVTFSIPAGDYTEPQVVTLNAPTLGAAIYYTTNGADPTTSDTPIASGATVSVTGTMTLKARAFLAGLFASPTTAARYTIGLGSTTEAAAWTNTVNVTATGNSITKTSGGSSGFDAGAVSTRAIYSTDGYVELSAGTALSGVRYAGLSNGDTDVSYGDIDYAFCPAGSNGLQICEGGVVRGTFGSYLATDTLRVGVEQGVVTYRKNGAFLYASPIPPAYPLLVDTTLYYLSHSISNVFISGALVDSRLPAPTADPAAGAYVPPVNVSLTTVPGATIRYTTDGSTPTSASPLYGGTPIVLGASTSIKAIADAPGYLTSPVMTAAYVALAATPTITPNGGAFMDSVPVTLATATSGATVRYTLDGTEPTTASVAYSTPLLLVSTATLMAKAFHTTLAPSSTATALFTIAPTPPTLSPGSGTYTTSVSVAMSGPAGASIYYTTDGSTPTLLSTPYAGAVVLTETTTIKAAAFLAGGQSSAVSTGVYSIKVADPVLSPASGRWYTQQTIGVTTATPGATIYYTTDGTEPTTSSATVAGTGQLLIDRSMAVKFKAFKANTQPSATVHASYLITGQMAAGDYHTLALKADRTVWAWGTNNYGQVGDGSATGTVRSSPIQITALSDIVEIAAGRYSSYALKADGTVWAWGYNVSGELGDGSNTNRYLPVQVSGLTGVQAIGAGGSHGLAVLSDGTVRTWGLNNYGQLGRGNSTNSNVPVTATGLGSVRSVTGGDSHSLALRTDGTVAGWGWGGLGQLGNGGQNSNVPVTLSGVVATALAANGHSSFAIVGATRQLKAWGLNSNGQLGDGSTTNRLTPVLITSNVRAVAAGGSHMAMVGSDGRLQGSGNNGLRQLGDATTLSRTLPTRSRVSRFVVTLAEGYYHSLAVAPDGAVWGTGNNINAQLGLGNSVSPVLPTMIPAFSLFNATELQQDLDNDGLNLFEEFMFGTDPLLGDTNGNGLSDGAECALGFDATALDSDGDGLTNDAEVVAGTNPFSADTDGDGYADGVDQLPLDSSQHTLSPTPGDTTPPVITLIKPTGAISIP